MSTANTSKADIIILGMGPTRVQCPFDAETWSVNTGYRQIAEAHGRLDKIFLAHRQVYDKDGVPYFNWEEMNALGVEIINTHIVKGLNMRRFPFQSICRKFKTAYFSDTIAYMIAYALHIHSRRIKGIPVLRQPLRLRLYGVDMLECGKEGEYSHERPGLEYWIGRAEAMGAEVTISKGSMLKKTLTGRPYGARGKDLPSYLDSFLATSTGQIVTIGMIDLSEEWLKEHGIA